MTDRRFPLLDGGTVAWSIAEIAYTEYKRRFSNDQTLERIAERGGFHRKELDILYPEWRGDPAYEGPRKGV